MHTEHANKLLDSRQGLDRAVKAVEMASVITLASRVATMMKAREAHDEVVMDIARELAKVAD